MKLPQIENYLFSLTKQSFLKNDAWKKHRFKRMQCLLDLLQNPEQKISHYIHITGTNGKGSVAIMLATILKTAGYKTGLLISPHPTHITERWQINNRPMGKVIFEKLFTKIHKQLQNYEHSEIYQRCGPISYGELMTIIGLYYFAELRVAWAVVEVSVGGRGDSTAIIPYKDLAIITNIGIDHTKKLGQTKAAIVNEKLGILHSHTPLFTGEKNKQIIAIMQQACKKQKSTLYQTNYLYHLQVYDLDGTDFIYQGTHYHLPVIGNHQIHNALLSIDSARYLNIPKPIIQKALKKVLLPVRLEIISKKPLIILDSAHNRDKMKSTAETLQKIITTGIKKIYILLAITNRRDLVMKIKPLDRVSPTKIVCTRTSTTLQPELFSAHVKRLFPTTIVELNSNYIDAFKKLQKHLRPHDALLITGSVYLGGALRTILKKSR
jgi:dihydrofolate synthase/folylpolyglutamate synthase